MNWGLTGLREKESQHTAFACCEQPTSQSSMKNSPQKEDILIEERSLVISELVIPDEIAIKQVEGGQGIDFDHPDYLVTDQLLHVQKGFANDIAASLNKRLACLCKRMTEYEDIFRE